MLTWFRRPAHRLPPIGLSGHSNPSPEHNPNRQPRSWFRPVLRLFLPFQAKNCRFLPPTPPASRLLNPLALPIFTRQTPVFSSANTPPAAEAPAHPGLVAFFGHRP